MRLLVSCEPLLAGGVFVGCLASFRPSETLPLPSVSAALMQISYAQCLISAGVTHAMVSGESCKQPFANYPLPEPASLMYGSATSGWRPFLHEAGDCQRIICQHSISAQDTSLKRHAQEHSLKNLAVNRPIWNTLNKAIFVPVDQEHDSRVNSRVNDLALPPLILPASSASMMGSFGNAGNVAGPSNHKLEGVRAAAATAFALAEQAAPRQETSGLCWKDFSTAGETEAATVSTAAAHEVPMDPSCQTATVSACATGTAALVDRVKDSQILTPAILAALQGQPLPAAARAVGMSATAFKRACRRLGIRRWGFRRGPGRRRLGGGSLGERSDDAATPV